ncbi:MAG: lipopolysaccharide transport periplasmic protein LptA [Candidatus Magnetoovum sp. WYHC-5]|nr:lipopolysaccharide transport periplasmic protein LptA [Candidatus Magnetoovum sp. WYHC-5]
MLRLLLSKHIIFVLLIAILIVNPEGKYAICAEVAGANDNGTSNTAPVQKEKKTKRDLKDSLKGDKNEPLVITSNTLVADNMNNMATFSGNVQATRGDIAFYADTMVVNYDAGGNITQIDAHGNIKLTRQKKTLVSSRAIYNTTKEQLIFTGNPEARDGKNVIKGTKMTYYVKEDRSVVENSKVFLVNE